LIYLPLNNTIPLFQRMVLSAIAGVISPAMADALSRPP